MTRRIVCCFHGSDEEWPTFAKRCLHGSRLHWQQSGIPTMGPCHRRFAEAVGGACGAPSGAGAGQVDIPRLGVARFLVLRHSAWCLHSRNSGPSNHLKPGHMHLGERRWDDLFQATAAEVADEPWQTMAQDRERRATVEAQFIASAMRVTTAEAAEGATRAAHDGQRRRDGCDIMHYTKHGHDGCIVRSESMHNSVLQPA